MLIAIFLTTFLIYMTSFNDLFPELAFLRLGLILNVASMGALILSFAISAKRTWPPQHTLMLALWGLVVVSRILNGRYSASLDALMLFMPCVMLYLLLSWGASKREDLVLGLRGIVLTATVLSVAAIAAAFWGGDDTPWVLQQGKSELDDFGVREYIARSQALGTLNDPNAFAQFLIAVLPLVWVFIRGTSPIWAAIRVCSTGTILYCAYLTRSRGGLIGLAVFSMLLLKRKVGSVLSIAVGASMFLTLLAAGFSGGRSISLTEGENRMDIWADGLAAFKSSPVWGVGFGLFTEHSLYSAHNALVECFTELGFVGYFVWLALLVTTYWQLNAIERYVLLGELDAWFASAAWAMKLSLASYVTMSLFLARAFAVPLYVLLGGAVALYSLAVDSSPGLIQERPPSKWLRDTLVVSCSSFVALYALLRIT